MARADYHSIRSWAAVPFRETSMMSASKRLSEPRRCFSRQSSDTSTTVSPCIHILGIGNVGGLFAHALSTSPNPPPVTLLFHRQSLVEEWNNASKEIHLSPHGTSHTYDIQPGWSRTTPSVPISNLIICVKATSTAAALANVAHLLDCTSTVLLTQNGMGVLETALSTIPSFRSPSTRPNFLSAINSHGVKSSSPFRYIHSGTGTVNIGSSNAPSLPTLKPERGYLLQHILHAPLLNATFLSATELTIKQLEKLAVNAVINSLTALLHRPNGFLLEAPEMPDIVEFLLNEISMILLSLPEVRCLSKTEQEAFGPNQLRHAVYTVALNTGSNRSSMLQDVEKGKETEIDFINGYLLSRAKESDLPAPCMERVIRMIKKREIVEVEDMKNKIVEV